MPDPDVQPNDAMTNASDLYLAMLKAIRSRDFDSLRKLFGPESIQMSGDGVEQRGPESVVGEVETFTTAFPDLTIEIRRQYAPDDNVSAIEYTVSGTQEGSMEERAPTGREISVVTCSVLEARDGVIVRPSWRSSASSERAASRNTPSRFEGIGILEGTSSGR
jgi:predicted ester cyclase